MFREPEEDHGDSKMSFSSKTYRKYRSQIRRTIISTVLIICVCWFLVAIAADMTSMFGSSLSGQAGYVHESTHFGRHLLFAKESDNRSAGQHKNVSENDASNTTTIKEAKKWTCAPASIEQFPRTLMSKYTREHGGVIIHLIVALYTFLALAVICDDYFVPSLEKLCDNMNLSSDVAGATFMAAGSSAPELAASVIAVFVSKDDVGLGTVVGSAVFNITLVISVCALFSGLVIDLHWWPMFRDCTYYMISIIALALCIMDETITWFESLILLLLYVLYVVIMANNAVFEKWALSLPISLNNMRTDSGEQTGLMKEDGLAINGKNGSVNAEYIISSSDEEINTTVILERTHANGIQSTEDSGKKKACTKLFNIITLPITTLAWITIPDCRKDSCSRYYMATLIMSVIWISLYSYILVWMITVIGSTVGVSDSIMGLTFLAAGVSTPDALSSLAVAKEGLGDMAVSNAVGSNVFDILLCLGFPWFLKTAIISTGSSVPIYSRGLLYSTLSLLATVVFLLVATHMNSWKLNKKYGIILLVWYFLFTIITTLYELDLFGELSLPTCPSSY